MRFLTPLAVCVASLLITTRGAEAGPIHAVEAVIHDNLGDPARWLPVAARNHDIRDFFDHFESFAIDVVKTGQDRPHLIEWNDDLVFLGLLARSGIGWTWHRALKPDREKPAGVPEPSALVLMGLGAVAFVRRRRARAIAPSATSRTARLLTLRARITAWVLAESGPS